MGEISNLKNVNCEKTLGRANFTCGGSTEISSWARIAPSILHVVLLLLIFVYNQSTDEFSSSIMLWFIIKL